MFRSRTRLLAAGLALATLTMGCGNDDEGSGDGGPASVKVGALYPLSGANASAGNDTLNGVKLAVDIINNDYPDLDLPFGPGRGIPGLEGATIQLVSADTAGSPETGASEVDRLVTTENVAAVVGSFQSAVTLTASQRAERLGVPFVNGESSAVGLTERGLKWFFRTGPTDRTFGEGFFAFLDQQKAAGHLIANVAILHTNDQYGTDGAAVTTELAEAGGYDVVADVSYDQATTDLSPQVQQIRAAQPDVLFVLSFTNDAILLVKTMEQLGYKPPAVLAYGAGFSDPKFREGVGPSAEGMISRAAWSADLAQSRPAVATIADMYQAQFNQPMTENSARSFTAVLALAQAFDAAGSTDPEPVRDALAKLDIAGDDTIMPWDGITFDDEHQNTGARGVVQQIQDGTYRVVFPDAIATTEAAWPLAGS